MWQE
ncbi:hypothetical protein E2C01_049212 [Portunus trituberculatus]